MRSSLLLLVFVACAASPNGSSDTTKGKADTAKQEPAADTCSASALGLGDAKPVAVFRAPEQCKPNGSGNTPEAIRDEATFRERFACTAASGVDFTKHDLMVVDRTLSPAGAGNAIVDDGTKVTFVAKFRGPCPGDPQPMPMPFSLAFLLPANATRTYGEVGCALPASCR